MPKHIEVRPFTRGDSHATLELFLRAIRETAAPDYSPEQIEAWASDDIDSAEWLDRRAQQNTAVALADGVVAGFADVDAAGYIDMMFVDPRFARRGVATQLFYWILMTARRDAAQNLTTNASITARPFFEAHGFLVTRERQTVVRGVALTNYAMNRAVRPD